MLHDPSEPDGASQMVWGGPPETSTFFSLPPLKNATMRLSGDQNARMAPSVPLSGRPSNESSDRTQSSRRPCASLAANTIARPSGDTLGSPGLDAPSGVCSRKRTTRGGSGSRRVQATANPTAASAATAATAHASHWRVFRFAATTAGSPTFDPPCDTHRSSDATSRIVCHRSSGSFARHRLTIRSSAGGVSGISSPIGCGVIASTDAMTVEALFPSNARFPVNSS